MSERRCGVAGCSEACFEGAVRCMDHRTHSGHGCLIVGCRPSTLGWLCQEHAPRWLAWPEGGPSGTRAFVAHEAALLAPVPSPHPWPAACLVSGCPRPAERLTARADTVRPGMASTRYCAEHAGTDYAPEPYRCERGCGREAVEGGRYCLDHTLGSPKCTVRGCERPRPAGDLCREHYRQWPDNLPLSDFLASLVRPAERAGEGRCQEPGCGYPAHRAGDYVGPYCTQHEIVRGPQWGWCEHRSGDHDLLCGRWAVLSDSPRCAQHGGRDYVPGQPSSTTAPARQLAPVPGLGNAVTTHGLPADAALDPELVEAALTGAGVPTGTATPSPRTERDEESEAPADLDSRLHRWCRWGTESDDPEDCFKYRLPGSPFCAQHADEGEAALRAEWERECERRRTAPTETVTRSAGTCDPIERREVPGVTYARPVSTASQPPTWPSPLVPYREGLSPLTLATFAAIDRRRGIEPPLCVNAQCGAPRAPGSALCGRCRREVAA